MTQIIHAQNDMALCSKCNRYSIRLPKEDDQLIDAIISGGNLISLPCRTPHCTGHLELGGKKV